VLTVQRLADGLRLAGHPALSAAIVDFRLSDGYATELCARLKQRGVPFVLYSGYPHVDEACRSGVVVAKPATSHQLVTAVAGLVGS
jgi:hypothetical protein